MACSCLAAQLLLLLLLLLYYPACIASPAHSVSCKAMTALHCCNLLCFAAVFDAQQSHGLQTPSKHVPRCLLQPLQCAWPSHPCRSHLLLLLLLLLLDAPHCCLLG
jgi:hypothetical protein